MIKILENPNPDTTQYKAVCSVCSCKVTFGSGDTVVMPTPFGGTKECIYCPNCGTPILLSAAQKVKLENYKINENGNITTCAVILKNKQNEILGCHPTGQPKGIHLSLPKGCVDEGEVDIQAAIRELSEETGYIVPKEHLMDLGMFTYVRGKDIHLFLHIPTVDITTNRFGCRSTFERNGKQIPEVDAYYWVKPDEWHLFSKSLQEVLNKVRDKIIS